jgi:autotransporter-associated beta strand protein
LVQPSAFRFSLFAFRFSPLALLLSLLLLAPSASAATATNTNNSLGWDTNSTGWDTVTGNAWSSVNGPTNTAVFTNTSGSIQVLNPITIGGLTYSPAGTFSIWGSQINLGTNSTFNVTNAASALTILSTIAGNYSLTKSGSGTLALSSSNSYSGGTTVSAGTVAVGDKNALGTGVVTLSGGTIRASTDLSGANAITNNFFNNSGTATFTGSNNLTISGAWTNNGSRSIANNMNDNATLTLSSPIGISATTGTQTLTLGGTAGNTTAITGNISNGTSTTGILTVNSSGVTSLSGSNSYTGGTLFSGNGFLLLGNRNALGTRSVTYNGGGTIRASTDLSGANAITNNFYLANTATLSGTNNLTISGAWTNNGSRTINSTMLNNASLTFSGPVIISDTAGAATLTIAANSTSGNTVISGNISNGNSTSGSLLKSGAGALTLSGSNTYNGLTTVTAGTLRVGNNSALGTGTLVLNGGALSASDSVTARTVTNKILFSTNATLGDSVNNAALTLSGIGDLGTNTRTLTINSAVTFAGVLSNTAGITVGGVAGNLLTLSGNNTYSGTTTVGNNSRLLIQNNNGLGATSGTTTVSSGGALQLQGGITVGAEALTLNGTGVNNIGGALRNISGTNTYGGAITLAANSRINSDADLLIITGGITGATRALTVGGSGNTTINSAIDTTTGTLTKDGTGTLTLSGVNTFTGNTTISAGVLTIAATTALPGWNTSGIYSVGNGATLAVYNAVTDANITNMVYGTTNFTSGSAIGFDTTTANRTSSLVLSNTSRGNLGLSKMGANTLTLSGVNTYTGTTTIFGGTLLASNTNALGATNGAIAAMGGILDLGGNAFNRTGLITFSGGTVTNGTLSNNTTTNFAAQSGTVAAILAGSAGLTQSGTGTTTLAAANTYTGTTTISGGTLAYGINDAIVNANAVTVNGGTLAIGAFSDTVGAVTLGSGSITGTTGVLTGSSYSVTSGLISANLGGSSSTLTKGGTGIVTLSGSNSYSNTVVNAGILSIATTNALPGWSTSGAYSVASGATLAVYNIFTDADITSMVYGTTNFASGSAIGYDTTSGNRTLTLALSNTANGAGILGLTKAGANTLTIANADALGDGSGALTVSGGTLDLGGFSSLRTGLITFSGGSVINGILSNNTATSFSATGTGTVSATLAGSAGLTQSGTGTLTLAAANTYTGTTTVNGGTLRLGDGGSTGSLATSDAIVNNGNLTIDRSNQVTQGTDFSSAAITGNGSFTQAGTGTTTLTAANTYSGTTTVNAGTLQVGNNSALGTGTLVLNGGALSASDDVTARTLTNNFRFSNNATLGDSVNSAALTLSGTGDLGTTTRTLTNNSDVTFAGVLSNTAGITKAGTGTLTLAAANTYTGLTTVNAGTLRYGTNNAIATGGVTVNGSTLDIGAFSDTVGAITVSAGGNITGTTGVLTGTGMTVTSAQGNSLISANLGGAYRLNITGNNLGTGTVTLSGSNSFTGVELANANTVRLNINNNNALGTGSLTLANSEIGNTSGSVVTVTNTFFIGGNTSFTWMGGHLVGKVFITDSTSAAFRMANAGSLTFDRLDSSAGSRILSFGDNTSGMDGQFIIKEAAGSNISGAVTLGSSGAQIWNFLLGSGRAFGTGTITVGSGFNIQASQDLTGANAFNNVWLLNNVSGANNPYTFSGSNSIALNGTLSVTNANTGQQIVNNISTGKTLTLTNVNLNLNTNTTSSFETVFSGPGDTIITGTVSNGAGTSRALTYRGTNATSTNAGSLTLMGSNTYNGLTTVTAGTLRVGNNSALGTGTLLLNGGALSASDSVTARTLTNNFRFSNNATLGDSVNSAALTLSGTGDLGTTTRIITNNSAVTFAGVLSNTAGITKAGNGTLTLAAANTYNGTTTVNAGTLAYGINDAIATNGVIVNGGTLDIGAFSDTVGAVTLGSGTISGGTGTLTGSSYSVTNTSGNALISAILGGSGTLTKTGAGILSIARTNALPGWSTSGRFSVASGSTLAVYNAFSDADITTMVYGTTNFASNSAIGFDTTTDNREYSLVLSNTSRGNLGLTKTGANTLTLTAANSYTGTTTVNGGTLALSGGDNRLSTAGSVAVSSGATLNLGGNSQTLAGLTGSGSVTNTAGTLTLDVASGNNTFGGSISGSGSLTKSGNGTVTLTSANTYTGTTTINGGTLRINSSSAIGTNTVTLANATFLSYIGSGVSSLNNAITVGSGTATIDNSGGSTLTLGGTLAKNGTTLTLNGGSGGINVTGSITGSDPNSDLVIGSGTVTLSGSNSYNGPTFVNNGATLNADSALPTDNGASDLLLDSTGSGGSTVNLGIDQTIASLSGASSSTVNLNARTLTINSGSGTVTYAGSITGSGNLLKSGSLTQMLTGTSAYTGTTTVNGGALSLGTSGKLTGTTSVTVTNGATLLLGSSVANSINSAAALNLGGGQLSMGAAGTGGSRASSQTFASLTLTANSSIDFSSLTGSSSLYFSNISGLSGYTLSIYNYNGQTTGSGTDFTKLYAATSSTGGFSANLGNILFYSGGDTSSLLGSASFGGTVGGFTEITDIVPVPEPSVVIAALMLLAWLLYTNRGAMRRLIGC